MNCLRTLALAAAPTAMLIGLAGAPASAAGVTAPKAPVPAKSVCGTAVAGQVLTAKNAAQLKTCAVKKAVLARSWHWMGNYDSVYAVTAAANSHHVGAGGLITMGDANGLYPTFMYY